MTKFQSLCIASILLSGLLHLNKDSQAQPVDTILTKAQHPVITNIITLPSLSADTNEPSTSTFPLGETVEIFFSVSGLADDKKTTLILDIQNEFGESIVKPQPVPLQVEGGGRAKYTLPAPASRLGYYEIKAKLSDGTPLSGLGTRPEGLISYAVVPDSRTRIDYGDKYSRFGLQGGFSTSALVLPYLGARYMLSGNNWERMEPDYPGQFTQERSKADRAGKRHPVKAAENENPIFNGGKWSTYHISTVTSAGLPPWALKPNTSGTICKKFGELNEEGEKALPAFALAHATAFAADYNYQSSRYYQVTWEPAAGWCYGGTPAGLVKIFAQPYNAIHQGDPQAVVVGPTLFLEKNSTAQLRALWDAGLARSLDALSIHPYISGWPPETHGMPTILREQLATAKNAKGRPVRFLGTEQGYTSADHGNLKKAMGDIRLTLMMLGEGADLDFGFYVADFLEGEGAKTNKGYGYYWNLNTSINFGTDKLGPKIIVPAYAAMTYFLDGTTSLGPLADLKGTQLGYTFKKAHATIVAVWDYDGSSSYKVPAGVKVCDWMGNCSEAKQSEITISGAPTYFIQGNVP